MHLGSSFKRLIYMEFMDFMDFFIAVESGSSNPDSGPNSPPIHASAQLSPPAGHTTPIQEVSDLLNCQVIAGCKAVDALCSLPGGVFSCRF